MEKLLITGGSGFIGRNLLPLIANNYDVYILTSNPARADLTQYGKVLHCNILNRDDVEKTLFNIKADKLIHLAWGMEPSNYNLPSNFEWLSASINLLEVFHKAGGSSAAFAGSCVQYDWSFGGCIEGSTPNANSSIYGHCKNILQEFVLAYSKAHDMQCLWARPFFMYGPHEDERRLLAYVIKSLVENKQATIQNGEIYRDFLHAEDVAGLLLKLFEQGAAGVHNIASGNLISLGELGQSVANILECPELLTIKRPDNNSNKYVFANTEKVESTCDWQPRFDLNTGLQHTIEWWKNNV